MTGESKASTGRRPATPIVSSAHLVSEDAAELSEFEFGLIIAWNAFQRWIVRCAGAAGLSDLGPLDVLVLHSVNHRGREKKLADICFVLNIEDSHTVTYSLKKLARLELVAGSKRGKETFYATTEAGAAACAAYRGVRESCLISSLSAVAIDNAEIGAAADLLRALSGLYDQAARAATSL
jgi:predicted MarR family transcription regulator